MYLHAFLPYRHARCYFLLPVMCPIFGRVGVAALQPILAVANPARHGRGPRRAFGSFSEGRVCLSPELDDCLAFVETIASCLPMVEFPLAPAGAAPQVLPLVRLCLF